MRVFATTLLLLSVMVGLTLPTALAHPHETACDSPDSCAEFSTAGHFDDHPCDSCPPPAPCPCDHSDSEQSAPQDEDSDCPSPDHKHHHHHHCVCTAVSTSMITGSEPLSLHPPLPGDLAPTLGFLYAPESTAAVLERPPNS